MGLCRNRGLCVSHLLAEDGTASAGPSPSPALPPTKLSSLATLRPAIAVVVGALTVMFFVTFVLLLYVKYCKPGGGGEGGGRTGATSSASAARRNSGVERAVIEALPIFRFGSLLGHKEGLECAVCLAQFELAEVLRLLPKCKHAFHVECVDTWLDAHSTCPLCRSRVDPEDVLLVPDAGWPSAAAEQPAGECEKGTESKGGDETTDPKGRRVFGRHSWAGEKSSNSLQIVLQRADPDESRYRRSADSATRPARPAGSVGWFDRGRKDGLLLAQVVEREAAERWLGHRVVVSCGDDSAQGRWSDLRPSGLLFLRSEMIITDSRRCSVSRAGRTSCSSSGSGGGTGGISSSRCASEITGMRRYSRPSDGGARRQEEELRTMRRWLGLALNRTTWWAGSRDSGNDLTGTEADRYDVVGLGSDQIRHGRFLY